MILFEWDEAKAESNRRKHGVAFEDAVEVFEDTYLVIELERVVEGEQRWQALGLAGDVTLLLVACTFRDAEQNEIIRIISARKAEKREHVIYGKNRQKNSF